MQVVGRQLQFQLVGVEGSLSQKLQQALHQEVWARGIPDDLTAAPGSFNLYAAVEKAYVDMDGIASVSEVSVYIKDNYTFTVGDSASQYLGHWSRNGVIVVPATEAATLANFEWADWPVAVGDMRVSGNVYYPVRNRDFRNWQLAHNRGGDFLIYSDRRVLSLLLRPIKVRVDVVKLSSIVVALSVLILSRYVLDASLRQTMHACDSEPTPDGRYVVRQCLLRAGKARLLVLDARTGSLLADRTYSCEPADVKLLVSNHLAIDQCSEGSLIDLPPSTLDRIRAMLP